MNKQELKQLLKDSEVKELKIFGNEVYGIPSSTVLGLIDQLDEQSPICLEDIIKRINELVFETRGVWLSGIIDESVIGYGSVKYHEGYEQGRMDSMMEREKVKIPQFVADIIEEYKEKNAPIMDIFSEKFSNKQYNNWLIRSLNAYDRAARAWLDGYEVEKTKETLYTVTLKSSGQKLFYHEKDEEYLFSNYAKCFLKEHHTRKELEQSGFGWVFDCPGIEVEEVQDA
jgi:phage protein|nr:MAG TPA: Protein of unknown function (DUF1642) [Caudoviricetes sp.]